ncbi:hypothetical protein PC116_g17834 [Phytophthora cactorum]|nr:hypothetical protein PC116_g17834 [Phytophthora cactorum]
MESLVWVSIRTTAALSNTACPFPRHGHRRWWAA